MRVSLLVVSTLVGVVVAYLLERTARLGALEAMKRDDWHQKLVQHCGQLEQRSVLWEATAEERALLDRVFDSKNIKIATLQNRIDFSELQMTTTLGSGAFGTVFKADYRGQPVAAKRLHRNKMSERELNDIKETVESQLWMGRNANIVHLLGLAWSVESASVVQIMEVCAAHRLGRILVAFPSLSLPFPSLPYPYLTSPYLPSPPPYSSAPAARSPMRSA